MPQNLMNEEYFRKRMTAVHIINLVNYLKKNEITEENLNDEEIVKDLIHKGMGKSVKTTLRKNEINVFKETLRFFKIDKLKKTNLYRINRGILAVACVEHVLYPGKDHKEYRKIYRCHGLVATNMYKKLRELCDATTEGELDPVIVKSATSFFRSYLFSDKKTFLETVRSYLNTLNINYDEKLYILNASFQFINDTETINIVPLNKYVMNQEYFQKKRNSDVLINLVNYLEKKEVKEEDLENETILIDILRRGMKKFVTYLPSKLELKEFKKAILFFKIDYLTVTNLYRINRGILLVACVEYVLRPGKDDEEYRKIYDCDYYRATALYKELCDTLQKDKVSEAVTKSARSFFRCQQRYLETIRLYLQDIDIDSEEIEYIKNASIELIKNNIAFNADQPPKNMMDPIEDHPINLPTEDEQPLPPMPDVPSVDVDPPSVVSIPVDQGLIKSSEDKPPTNMMVLIEDQPSTSSVVSSENLNSCSLIDQALANLPRNVLDFLDQAARLSTNDEQPLPPMPDVPSVDVDPPSVVSIPVDQGLIRSNEDKPPTNMMVLIEDQPSTSSVVSSENLNSCRLIDELVASLPHDVPDFIDNQAAQLSTNDDLPLPSMLDVSSGNVDPPSVVSSPLVNQ